MCQRAGVEVADGDLVFNVVLGCSLRESIMIGAVSD
jgi:hypothetical protein